MGSPTDTRTPAAAAGTFHLLAAARQTVAGAGFEVDLSPAALAEVARLPAESPPLQPGVRDLREALWSSIDNADSRDLDQIEVAEALPGGDVRVWVGIADVDSLVPRGSALDARAAHNTASVYTGPTVFPMLPERLSCDLTSLNPGVDRLAVVMELVVRPDGTLVSSDVFRALVRNHAKLSYEGVGPWLEGRAALPPEVARVAGLEPQLRLQDEASRRLKRWRLQRGALEFETVEARPVVEGEKVVDVQLTLKSRSRELIEDLMVAANGAMSRCLDAYKRSAIARVVHTPRRWDRIVELARAAGTELPGTPDAVALADFLRARRAADPAHFAELSLAVVKLIGPGEYALEPAGVPNYGHFALAMADYTHGTAPNRRYADLVTQRLLKAALAGEPPPYSDEELAAIAQRCTQMDTLARKVERQLRKVASALLLRSRIGDTFDAIVTGVTDKGVFVRLLAPPAEGRVVRGEAGLDVGDALRVKLLATEPAKGFIDFARA
jgi:VacB/RNase II family 3'-5' exoribonuclease